jgi:predicted metal-binding membrane protein
MGQSPVSTRRSWPGIKGQRVLAGLLIALVLLAWWALWWWGKSPYGHLLLHGGNPGGVGAHHFSSSPAIFVLGWTLMTVAMMLPTSSPLILLFQRLVADRRHSSRLVTLLITGYLAAWMFFGVGVYFVNRAVRQAAQGSPWLSERPWVLASAILLLAGMYQFSSLKYACLDKCRSPLTFITERWRGGDENAQALRLGVEHGIFCVGCCWSLMLLMLVVGTGNLSWMLLLGIVMGVEKNFPWGRRLSAPLGALLVVGAALVVLMKV